jgi:hypothetical protein
VVGMSRDRWRNPDGKGRTHPRCPLCGGYGEVLIEPSNGGQWDICPAYEREISKGKT